MGIRVCDLNKRFGDFVAVDDVSFEIKTGELAALLGPSGSGKSTILRIIAGLENPDSGEIYLTGQQANRLSPQKRGVGFVFQHYALFKHMTAEQNIAFGLKIKKVHKNIIQKRVNELIELVKLRGYEAHYPCQLSGGQRQRVALARALATEPKVLLLDEPFGALDAKVRENLSQWLREFHDQLNITSIFVTHDQQEAIEIADKIVVINRGRVEQIGSARKVYECPQSKFVASFIGQVNVLDAVACNGRVTIKNSLIQVETDSLSRTHDGDIVILVRPEDIEITSERQECSLPASVLRFHYRGSHYEMDCSLGGTSVRIITGKNQFLSQDIKNGMNVGLKFKTCRIFDADDGHVRIRAQLKELGYIE